MPIVKNNKNYGTIVKLQGEGPDPILEHIDITMNGDYTPREGTDGWNSIHVDVPTSGDPSLIRSLIDKSIERYSDSELQAIGPYAFFGCWALQTLNCPKVTVIEEAALQGAGSSDGGTEVTLDWDNLEYLGAFALAGIKNNSFVTNAPVVINNNFTFAESHIATFNAPNASLESEWDDVRGLFMQTNLVNTNGVKSLLRNHRLDSTFTACNDLVNVDLEDITHIGGGVFSQCSNLENAHITTHPSWGAEWLFDSAFGDCPSLKTVVIEGLINIVGGNVFPRCSSLESLTLTNSDTVRNMYQHGMSANEFFGEDCNPNVNIYVPADVVDGLKEAWSDRADHIFSIS